MLLVLTSVLFISNANAQPYDISFGVRARFSSGLNLKYFFDREYAVDVHTLYNNRGFQVSAFYEYQFTPYDRKQLHYYLGIGPHFGNWDATTVGTADLALGAAGLAGAEFIFRKAPVIIALEWKPMINFYKDFDFVIPDFGVSIEVFIK